jgi:hypothetical protein
MDEENVGYWIDEEGGVHYRPDEEFQRARISTVAGLQTARYGAVRDAFEDALGHLDRQDGKGAIRSSFEAVETLAKLMAGDRKIARLGPSEVDRVLKPLAQNLYDTGTPERQAARAMLSSMSDWINAAQPYRHGQRTEEPAPPPLELSVAMVSAGAGYLRWLVEIDQRTRKQRT